MKDKKKPMTAAERKRKQRSKNRELGLIPIESWIHPDNKARFLKYTKRMQRPVK